MSSQGAVDTDAVALANFLARVVPAFGELPAPRSVAQAMTRNAARLSSIRLLCRDALDDAVNIIGREPGRETYAEAFIAIEQWAGGTLDDMAEGASDVAR